MDEREKYEDFFLLIIEVEKSLDSAQLPWAMKLLQYAHTVAEIWCTSRCCIVEFDVFCIKDEHRILVGPVYKLDET